MKKAISLILALVMCMSLCACGSKTASTKPKNTIPKTTIPETTPTETVGKITKEEMTARAEKLDCVTAVSDYESNPVNAKDKYTDKIFIVDGYVEKINSSDVIVVPINAPHKHGRTSLKLYLTLGSDDIKKLSTNGVATFVGQVSDVTGCLAQSWGAGLHMNIAYHVDDTTSFAGKVEKITSLTTMEGACYPYVELSVTEGDSEVRYSFVFEDGTDTAGISEGENIIITARMKFDQYMQHTDIKGYSYYSFEYTVKATTSIDKA